MDFEPGRWWDRFRPVRSWRRRDISIVVTGLTKSGQNLPTVGSGFDLENLLFAHALRRYSFRPRQWVGRVTSEGSAMLAPTSRAARARPRHTAAAVTAFLALAVAPSDAPAITTNWTASSGQFTTPTNWSAGVPGSADTAVFRRGLGITYSVTFPGGSLGTGPTMYSSDRAVVGNNFATFINSGGAREPSIYTLTTATTTEAGRGLIVGELASETGASLTSTLKELSTAAATLGDVAGSTGTLNINNGSLFSVTGSDAANVELIIANRGNAILNVNGGSDVTLTAPSGNAIVGYNAGSNGTLNVDGAGSTFAVTSSGFTVGHLGSGALNVTAGGQVTASITNLGRQPGASGSALISGAGSTFSSGQLTVGDQTTGTITVQNGGQLSSAAFATVGNQRVTGGTGNGTVTVDGAGSTWSTGTLALGVVGLGTLNVSNGGN